jgi:hypothetical protein
MELVQQIRKFIEAKKHQHRSEHCRTKEGSPSKQWSRIKPIKYVNYRRGHRRFVIAERPEPYANSALSVSGCFGIEIVKKAVHRRSVDKRSTEAQEPESFGQ